MQMEWNRIKLREIFFFLIRLWSEISRLSSGIWYEKDIIFHRHLRKKFENTVEYIDWSTGIYKQTELLPTQNRVFIHQGRWSGEMRWNRYAWWSATLHNFQTTFKKMTPFMLGFSGLSLLDSRSIHGLFYEATMMSHKESRDTVGDWQGKDAADCYSRRRLNRCWKSSGLFSWSRKWNYNLKRSRNLL